MNQPRLFEHSGTAVLSPCGAYRYVLRRQWSEGETCAFIGLNPSTADAERDDPTIRRCVGFAKSWGYGRLVMLNLFALRSRDPARVRAMLPDARGPENDAWIETEAMRADIIIAAWGAPRWAKDRADQVCSMLRDLGVPLHVLDLTKDGSPGHPLYLRGNLKPARWRGVR